MARKPAVRNVTRAAIARMTPAQLKKTMRTHPLAPSRKLAYGRLIALGRL